MPTESLGIDGQRIVFIGIGGGSDCVQAAILAVLCRKPACVISIRSSLISSQGRTGVMGEKRTVHDHGGEIADDVFIITPHTRGSGRFLEAIPADRVPMYLVLDRHDGTLTAQIQSVLNHFGKIDTVVAVDTGGDCLYRADSADVTGITPEQDLASLQAIGDLKDMTLLSCVIACGVDAPDYAADILSAANSHCHLFKPSDTQRILALYTEFQMDGTHPDRFGKTAFAWQAALRGETGRVRLPLPDHIINDPANPWNPYVEIKPAMAGLYLMDLINHLQAIR